MQGDLQIGFCGLKKVYVEGMKREAVWMYVLDANGGCEVFVTARTRLGWVWFKKHGE